MEQKVVDFKSHINQIAELGWQEMKTTQYIKSTLGERPLKLGFAGKKVGLLYKIGNGRQAILMRADIDALKTRKGVEHICGHSSNVSALMGAFLYTLKKLKQLDQVNKSIYFLFQPAEETYPSGAKAFVEECQGILSEAKYAFAAHARPLLPLGVIGLRKGTLWARGDYMEVEVFGRMVHIKNTPEGIDALEAASQLVLYIKSLQKRFQKKLRINIGVFNGGLQPNAVANFALLKGDIRLKKDKDQVMVKRLLQNEINEIEKKLKAKIKLHYYSGYPALQNNLKVTNEIIKLMRKDNYFKILTDKSLFSYGCEDFAFIAEKVPSVYALFGTGDKHDVHEEKCTISDAGTINIYRYFTNIINWWVGYN